MAQNPSPDSKRRRSEVITTLNQPPSGSSEEHTSELQSPCNLVCRLLLEKKKTLPAAASYTTVCAVLRLPHTKLCPHSCAVRHLKSSFHVHAGCTVHTPIAPAAQFYAKVD